MGGLSSARREKHTHTHTHLASLLTYPHVCGKVAAFHVRRGCSAQRARPFVHRVRTSFGMGGRCGASLPRLVAPHVFVPCVQQGCSAPCARPCSHRVRALFAVGDRSVASVSIAFCSAYVVIEASVSGLMSLCRMGLMRGECVHRVGDMSACRSVV